MSKRYGRNRKRRDREAIAELEFTKERLENRLSVADEAGRILGQRLRAQEAHVREIADTINDIVENSVVLPPDKLNLRDTADGDRLRYCRIRKEPLRVVRRWTEADPIEASTPEILEIDLWELRATMEADLYKFERLIHVLVPGPNGIAYRISEDVFRQFCSTGRLPELARQVYGQILGVLRKAAADRSSRVTR